MGHSKRGERIWTRSEVAERILAGERLIIRQGHVLRIPNSWMDQHPGGHLAILHFVGRDATDETTAFHSSQALDRMMSYSIGTVDVDDPSGWQPFVPPVMLGWVHKCGRWIQDAQALPLQTEHNHQSSAVPSSHILLIQKSLLSKPKELTRELLDPLPNSLLPAIQRRHSIEYHRLHEEIIKENLYQTPYFTGYGPEFIRYSSLGILSIMTYRHGWFLTSALFLGALWHQLAFIAHDLGHNGMTHVWTIDRVLGVLVADLIGGLSIGWWVDNHNIHHLVTNHPSHDPDIQHIPFFAISTDFAKSLWSSYYQRIMKFDRLSNLVIRFQHLLFYVVMSLARFNLYANSYIFLANRWKDGKKTRGGKWVWWLEILAIAIFWSWYIRVISGCGRPWMQLGYFLISNMVPSPLHVQIVLSHFSRSTADLGPNESFPHRQLRTTTDVICPDYLAFFHGGLHLQVTHHLYPRLPRHNLKRASMLVKQFAEREGLEYAEFGFIEGNAEVRGVLRQVATQISIMGSVAQGMSDASEA